MMKCGKSKVEVPHVPQFSPYYTPKVYKALVNPLNKHVNKC